MFMSRLVLLLVISSTVVAAQEATPQFKSAAKHYGKFLAAAKTFSLSLQAHCNTQECLNLANETYALVSDAKDKRHNKLLTKEEHAKFHKALTVNLRKVRNMLENREDREEQATKPESMQWIPSQTPDYGTNQECELCGTMLEWSMAACAATAAPAAGGFIPQSLTAGLICLTVAMGSYIKCSEKWCQQYDDAQGGGSYYNADEFDDRVEVDSVA